MGKVTDFEELFNIRYKDHLEGFATYKEMYRYFYMLGVRDAAQDAVDTLNDYACALAGTGQEHTYDTSAAALQIYFAKALDI